MVSNSTLNLDLHFHVNIIARPRNRATLGATRSAVAGESERRGSIFGFAFFYHCPLEVSQSDKPKLNLAIGFQAPQLTGEVKVLFTTRSIASV